LTRHLTKLDRTRAISDVAASLRHPLPRLNHKPTLEKRVNTMANVPRMVQFGLAMYGNGAFEEEVVELADRLAHVKIDQHYLLGIAGPPLSGARELADKIVRFLNSFYGAEEDAIAVHYDFFRRPGIQFKPSGNGGGEKRQIPYWSPGSFFSAEFVEYVTNIQQFPFDVNATSTYEHTTDEEIADGLIVRPSHKIVVVQCPFILHQAPPWTSLSNPRRLLHRIWYVDVPEKVLAQRLYDFYTTMGLNHVDAQGLVQNEDLATVRLVDRDKQAADLILTPTTTN